MENEDVFNGLGVEVRLEEEDDFLMVKETLTRMGVSSRKENKLFQSCHILHKRGRYAIMHFKELFILDGLESDISESDISRRNLIAKLIDEWELCEIINDAQIDPVANMGQIKIISHKDKKDWELIPKYHIGK
tara:strand:+ start:2362 stop:2760 length:399 start_codon:yes stop_codon:yes gene_type:complete